MVVALAMVGAAVAAQKVVPVRTLRLPDTAYEYANVPLPAHFQGARAIDNTPGDNPITNDGATLGRVLFYDPALSANNTTSCSSCHKQQHAFADPNRVSRGFDGRFTDRHAMNLTGLRYHPRARFFWDERGDNLEETVLLPVRNPIEMGGDPARLPQKLAALPYYPQLFRRAFGDPAITEPRIARALAQFLRSLVSYRSRFDEGMARAQSDEDDFENFTRQENRGKARFRRNCATCHSEAEEFPFALLLPSNNGTELDPRSADGGFAASRSTGSMPAASSRRPSAMSKWRDRTCTTARWPRSRMSWSTTAGASTGIRTSMSACSRSTSRNLRRLRSSRS